MEHLKNALSVFLCFVAVSFVLAIVIGIQVLLWCFIPAVVYWVSGWFTDDEMWRLGLTCAAFAGVVFRARGNFIKLIGKKLSNITVTAKEKEAD